MAKKKQVTTEVKDDVAAEFEKLQEQVSTLPSTEVVKHDKDYAAIHNMKAHQLGEKWGKETQKRNGMEIKYLREALKILNNVGEVEDVVDGYKEAGGDKATASRIKKILTAAMEDPACKAVVFDESSNSLQGAYQKIREIEKNTLKEALNDGEGELLDGRPEVYVPAGLDMKGLILQLENVLNVVEVFDDKAAKAIKQAIKSLESKAKYVEPVDADAWFHSKGQAARSKFMGAAEVVQ